MSSLVTTILEIILVGQLFFAVLLLYRRYLRTRKKVDLALLAGAIVSFLLYPVLLVPYIIPVTLSEKQLELYNAGYYLVGLLILSLLLYAFYRVEKSEKMLEKQVNRQKNELIDVKGQLQKNQLDHFEKMLEAADRMINITRHDLLEPFRTIDDGLMRLHLYPDDKVTYLEMDKAVSQLGASIDALTRYADYGEIQKNLTDLNELIENILDSANIPPGINVIFESSEGFIAVQVDSSKLGQAIKHLLDNAVESIEGTGTIWVSLSKKEFLVSITICDDGHGIPIEDQKKIFTPFYTTKEDGMGLGLLYVKDIVESHGGEVSFTSNDEETCFTVTIPEKHLHRQNPSHQDNNHTGP